MPQFCIWVMKHVILLILLSLKKYKGHFPKQDRLESAELDCCI